MQFVKIDSLLQSAALNIFMIKTVKTSGGLWANFPNAMELREGFQLTTWA